MKDGLLWSKSLLCQSVTHQRQSYLPYVTHSFLSSWKKHSEFHNQIHGTGNILYYTVHLFGIFFPHEENNFQNKPKADAEIRMMLERSVTRRRWEFNNPMYTDVETVEQGQAPPTSQSPTGARHHACGQSCGTPGLQTQGSDTLCLLNARGMHLTSSQTPRLSGTRWKETSGKEELWDTPENQSSAGRNFYF